MGVGFDRLAPCFFGVDLKCEKMNFRQGHTFTCFLIVEHLNDKYFIRKWALQLLMARRDSWYYFYGSQEPLWHWMMDEADVLLHPDPDDEKVAVTVGCRDIDDFVNELDICLNAGWTAKGPADSPGQPEPQVGLHPCEAPGRHPRLLVGSKVQIR